MYICIFHTFFYACVHVHVYGSNKYFAQSGFGYTGLKTSRMMFKNSRRIILKECK